MNEPPKPCLYPEYAVGIRAFGVHIAQDDFAQPRCVKNAIHGATIGMWESRRLPGGGYRKITYWERVIP